jgi:hypothetical protein
MESKEYSWEWVTYDQCLRHKECELVYAYLVPTAQAGDSVIYDGENTSGRPIATLRSAVATGHAFKPKEPIYCRRGLFVDVGDSVTGILVQWRNL